MNAQDYYRQLVALIGSVSSIVASEVSFREISGTECYVKAALTLPKGYELHLAEYVSIQAEQVVRTKYRYQLLTPDMKPLARWDNAPHHQSVPTFPDHRHNTADKAHPSRAMTPADAIADSLALVESQSPC